MNKHEWGFFWGMVLGAAAAAVVGGVILAKSFRSCSVGIDSWEDLPKVREKPAAGRGKARKRRPAAKK